MNSRRGDIPEVPGGMVGRFLPAVLLAVALLSIGHGRACAQPSALGVLYTENFNDGRAQGWSLESGWTVSDGALRGEGGGRARYVGGRWRNASISFRLRADEVRLLFSATESGYYLIRFLRRGDQLILDLGKRLPSGGGIDRLGSGTIPSGEGETHQVEVVTRNEEIRVTVDGRDAMTGADPAPLPAGTIAFTAPDRGFAVVDDIVVSEAGTVQVVAPRQIERVEPPAATRPAIGVIGGFAGRVFEGDRGDTTRPIPGAAVSLYGTNDAGTRGTLLQSTTTDSRGRFHLSVGLADAAYEFFGIREEDLPGYKSVDAFGPGATVIDENWIEHLGPIDERTRSGNNFWDRIERPDLMIDAAHCEVAGDAEILLVVAEVWNVGTLPAPESVVQVSSGDWSGRTPLRALAVRGYERVEIRLDIGNEHRGLTHTFRVDVDPADAIAELDEANNVVMTGECRIPGLPDLAVEPPSAEILGDARTIRVSAAIANIGESNSPATVVHISSTPWQKEVRLRPLSAGEREAVEASFPIPDEARGRERTFRISVDPEALIKEAGKGNNAAQTRPVLIPHLPDLVVREAHAEMLADAHTVKIVTEIGNAGGAAARSVVARAASGDWSGTANVSELAAGSNTRAEIRLKIRPADRGRQHAFRIDIDPGGRIAELNEDNNSHQTARLQIPELPDLRVREAAAEILDDAVTLRITATIVNSGGASAVGAKVRARSGDWTCPMADGPTLSPGESGEVEIDEEIPSEQRGKSHKFEVHVDPDDAITELDEANNGAQTPELYFPDLPDLVIRGLRAVVAEDGRRVLVTAEIANRGSASSSACLVRVSAEDWDTAERTAPALEPGSADSILFGLEIKGRHRNRAHQFEMSLDPDRIILELDETNNVERTRRVSIGRWTPPLWAVATVVVVVIAAAGLTLRWRRKIRDRKRWQETAIDGELPESCEPCTRICRRIEAELEAPTREMTHLVLHAMDPGSDLSRRKTVVRGKGVEHLNKAAASHRGGAKPEGLEAQMKPLAESLVGEIMKWLRPEAVPQDVKLVGHLQGGRVTYEFTLYHCKRVGMESVWDEEDTWKATVEDERAETLGILANLDPTDDSAPAKRVEELIRFLMAFLRKA